MNQAVSYDHGKLLAYLDETLVRGEVVMVLPSEREAVNMRWALSKRRGTRPISIHVKHKTLTLRLKTQSREKVL